MSNAELPSPERLLESLSRPEVVENTQKLLAALQQNLPQTLEVAREIRNAFVEVGILDTRFRVAGVLGGTTNPDGTPRPSERPSATTVAPAIPGPRRPPLGPRPPERAPERVPDPVVQGIRDQARELVGIALSRNVNDAARQASERYGLTPQQYHRLVLMNPTDPSTVEGEALRRTAADEAAGRSPNRPPYRGEFHRASGNTDTLVVMCGGGAGGALRDENGPPRWERSRTGPNPPRRGLTHLFNRLRTERPDAQDVLLLRSGNALDLQTTQLHNSVAYAHVKRLVLDALTGQGTFNGRNYRKLRFAGFSYGAGVIRELLRDGEVTAALAGRTIEGTAFVDGIEFRGLRGIDETPPLTQRHFHVYQPGSMLRPWVRGNAARPDPRTTNLRMDFPGVTHGMLQNVADPRISPTFDRIFRMLSEPGAPL